MKKTIVNTNNNVVLWDVDETLISFNSIKDVDPLYLDDFYASLPIYPIEIEIKRLKEAKARGHFVRVHSQGGYEWALAIVTLLKLDEYVDSIETKPKWYHDDLPADSWMTRFYEGPKK